MQRLSVTVTVGLVAVLCGWLLPAAASGAGRVLDTFDSPEGWKVVTSEAVNLTIAGDSGGRRGGCVRLDYDFTRGSGYAIIRKTFNVPLPENYRFTFAVRGSGPRNTLEFKLLDQSLENVWWLNQPNFEFPTQWREVSIPKRKIAFAWGPSHGQTALSVAHAIEFVITSYNGGKGTVWLDDFQFDPLPIAQPPTAPAKITVSSTARDTIPPQILATDGSLGWFGGMNDAKPTCTITYPEPRDVGGLILSWSPKAHPENYRVELSRDGQTFEAAASVAGTDGGHDYIVLPDAVTRAIRITTDNPGRVIGLERVRLMPPEFADTRNAVIKVAAGDAPRGFYPRAFRDEATYWTIAGVSGDDNEVLVSQDGAVEVTKEGFSIEPFLTTTGGLRSFADAEISQTLEEGFLPVPSVTWKVGDLTLRMTFATEGTPGDSYLLVRYVLINTAREPRRGRLVLAIRPHQVNPPYQWLNTMGGVGRIDTIERKGDRAVVDGTQVVPLSSPTAFTAMRWDQGDISARLAEGSVPESTSVSDPSGLASGAMLFDFDLKPQGRLVAPVVVGLHKQAVSGDSNGFDARMLAAIEEWREKLSRVRIRLPSGAQRLADTVRANLAYILINRDGSSIHPGSRSYERAWIRDGSLTSAALLAFGFTDEAKAFADWFGPYQYDNGKVPCCVDRRGPDPVPEHDSHGQYIWLVRNVFEHTGDSEFLGRHYPRVLKAVEYIRYLRDQRNTQEYQEATGLEAAKRGLLPESISHEGYSAKPMHSYWDNFFAARGLSDAEHLARLMGDANNAALIGQLSSRFRDTLNDSLIRAMSQKEIDYLPGCVELGDFDATSTTVALWPCNLRGTIPDDALVRTFERYWAFFQERASGAKAWENYTPYEHRTVGSMIMLGRRERAHAIWDWFFGHQRPAGWRHWGEVVWNDSKTPKFIGDMPHTWVGSDFINAFRTMFAFDRPDGSIVLGAGLPRAWAEEGVSIVGLTTSAGPLTLEMQRVEGEPNAPAAIEFRIGDALRLPAGGLLLAPPDPEAVAGVEVNGSVAAFEEPGMIRLTKLPAKITVRYNE